MQSRRDASTLDEKNANKVEHGGDKDPKNKNEMSGCPMHSMNLKSSSSDGHALHNSHGSTSSSSGGGSHGHSDHASKNKNYNNNNEMKEAIMRPDLSDGTVIGGEEYDRWSENQEGFDWQLELARRAIEEGPAFAPFRMSLWEPPEVEVGGPLPDFFYSARIIFNNALQMLGMSKGLDGAPLVQGVNTYKGGLVKLLAGVARGDLQTLAGGPLFLLLWKYYQKYGPVYKLAFGPKSFIVVSDPTMVKYILKENPGNYDKGILAEILEPVMGKGLIPADPETWKVRRKAIVPGFHKAWLNAMMGLFAECNAPLVEKLDRAAEKGTALDMETEFCSVALDIIGRAVFNYDFNSVTNESPVVKAVYRALQETEYRSMSFIPYWNLPGAPLYMNSLREFHKNMKLLNDVLDDLIKKAMESQVLMNEDEIQNQDFSKVENPSLLRFLVDMRGEEAGNIQLRDDLMTMLIAGHETTSAVLTWTFFEITQQPQLLQKLRDELETVLQGRTPTYEDMTNLPFMRACIAETLRMYPEPPLLIRRALADDQLPKGAAEAETFIPRGTDIFIATWNIHRSPDFWHEPERYNPERFFVPFENKKDTPWKGFIPGGPSSPYPNEVHSDFAFMPFGGGSRKCVGDQFAMMETTVTLATVLQNFDLAFVGDPGQVGMRTGATIHTANGLKMTVKRRGNKTKQIETKRNERTLSE
jgi:cytochrome P450